MNHSSAGPLLNNSANCFGGFRSVDNYNFKPDVDRGFIRTHAHAPATTSTSVLAISYDGGVLMTADLVGAYGSLMRYKNVPRLLRINNNIILGATGDIADFQYLSQIIKQKIIEEECLDDGISIKPKALYSWLTRVLYQRRSKFDPLWTTFVIAGLQDGQPYISCVDKLGTGFEDKQIATGFGHHLVTPLLRQAVENKPLPTKEEAIAILKKGMEILFYRDARSHDKYLMGWVDKSGATVDEPKFVQADWSLANHIQCA